MSTPTISTLEAITSLLFIESPVEPVDLMFVFGHDWIATMDEVKALYESGISNRILLSGHSASKDRSESEAARFMKQGLRLGIPQQVFLLEERATNTKENMEFSLPIIEENIGFSNVNSILFVCKAFHARRVLMTARRFFPEHIRYSFFPTVDERDIRRDNWWKDPVAFERVIAEVRRIAEYTLKGDLTVF